MKTFITFATLAFSLHAFSLEMGEKLIPKKRPDGTVAVGFTYTTPADIEGAKYWFTISPQLSAAMSTKVVKLNLFDMTSQRFLKDWSQQSAIPLAMVQYRESDATIVEKLLRAQGNTERDILIVVSENNGQTVSHHLSVAQFCKNYPEHFKDLTDGKACHEN